MMVEGYLVFDAVKEGKEACNCGSIKYVDHHLWLASTPSASRAKAIVVEVFAQNVGVSSGLEQS